MSLTTIPTCRDVEGCVLVIGHTGSHRDAAKNVLSNKDRGPVDFTVPKPELKDCPTAGCDFHAGHAGPCGKIPISVNLCLAARGAVECCRPLWHEGACEERRHARPIPSPPLNGLTPAARVPVDYRFDALNWDFIKGMAMIAAFADEKYIEVGGALQYATAEPLTGDKSPMNHVDEHKRQYVCGELHKHFKTRKAQLWAMAYNLMMEAHFLEDDPERSISILSRTKGQVGK